MIDDDEGVLAFAAEALHSFTPGFDVATARSLEEAHHWLDTFSPDLVVLDPRLSGGERRRLTARLRHRAGECKILVVSGDLAEEDRRDPARVGAQAVLRKPVRLEALLRTVRSICQP